MAIGAASGGVIVAKMGRDANFIADALTYLISAACVLSVKRTSSAESAAKQRNGEQEPFFDGISKGLRYIFDSQQKHLLTLLFIKGTAAVNWGLAELLEVEYARMSTMHQLGGLTTSLGLIYASSGLGCMIGPVVAGATTGGSEDSFKKAIVTAFAVSALSAALLLLAKSIYLVLASTFLRACSSSVIWIYSTLLIQKTGEPQFFGRIFSTEMFFFTCFKIFGLMLGGAFGDIDFLSGSHTTLIMVFTSLFVWFLWASHFKDPSTFRDEFGKNSNPIYKDESSSLIPELPPPDDHDSFDDVGTMSP